MPCPSPFSLYNRSRDRPPFTKTNLCCPPISIPLFRVHGEAGTYSDPGQEPGLTHQSPHGCLCHFPGSFLVPFFPSQERLREEQGGSQCSLKLFQQLCKGPALVCLLYNLLQQIFTLRCSLGEKYCFTSTPCPV